MKAPQRNYNPAINFHDGNGALWYRRKILIEPRFEVHLKASIEGIENPDPNKEYILEGFTIVISKNKNALSEGPGDYIGYFGFTKSYIIEFDFNRNLNDPDSNSYSLRYCDSDCSNDDAKALINGKLIYQRFDPTRTNNWDFRLVYEDKKLFLYSGPNDIIFTYNVDFYDVLQSNTAYIGFTGYMDNYGKELNVLGTFICEDNFDITRMVGQFYVDDETYDTYAYKAGEEIQYLFSFINVKGQVIPHCFGQGIWQYSFSLLVDCPSSNIQISAKDEYNLLFSMNACNALGEHKIAITETSQGTGPDNKYRIISVLNTITLVGHDGQITNIDSFSLLSEGDRTLTYGEKDGEFSLDEGSLSITLDYEMKDIFGNFAEIGTTSKEMLMTSGFSLSSENSAILEMKKIDSHYQLIFTVYKVDIYKIINNGYMSEAIVFEVISGDISITNSYCTLEGYTEIPTLQKGDTVHYNCYFKDIKGNLINTFLVLEKYDFSYQASVSPLQHTFINSIEDKTNHFDYTLQLTESGIFVFNGYLNPKGIINQKFEIPPKLNKVYVYSNDFQLLHGLIYNPYYGNMIDIDNGVIKYRNNQDGRLTLIDLVDPDGEFLISKYKKYPDNFDLSKIRVQIYNSHDLSYNFGELECRKDILDGVEYIGVYTKTGVRTDNVIKRSSFEYTLKFTYTKKDGTVEIKELQMQYYINLSGYKTCFHDLDVTKTSSNIREKLHVPTTETKIGKLELRTTDLYLFNCDIGIDKIKVILDNSDEANYRVVPLSIAGTYDVYVEVSNEYEGELKVTVNDYVVGKVLTYSYQEACYMKYNEPDLFEHLGDNRQEYFYEYLGEYPDGYFEFYFTVLDRYNNTINKTDYFDSFVDVFSHTYGNDLAPIITYDLSIKSFKFRDPLQFPNRKYTWVFVMRDSTCNNKYYITYNSTKSRNHFSIKYSYYYLFQNNLYVNEYSYIDVILKDNYDKFMGFSHSLSELKKYVVVLAEDNESKEEFLYEFDQITNNYTIRFKYQYTVPFNLKVKAYYKNYELSCQGSNDLITTFHFSLEQSKLQMITDSIIHIYPRQPITIKNSTQIPSYTLLLYAANGERTTFSEVDTFSCVMTGEQVNME